MLEPGTYRHRFARTVSLLFQPALTGSYLLAAVSAIAGATPGEAAAWAALTITFSAVIPMGVVAYWVRTGSLTDFDLALREQRPGPLLVALAGSAAALALTAVLGAPALVVHTLTVALVSGSVLTLVTTRWKISFHAGSLSAALVILGWAAGAVTVAVALVPILVTVGWSRVALARHTTVQVVAGAFTSAAVAYAVLWAVQ